MTSKPLAPQPSPGSAAERRLDGGRGRPAVSNTRLGL